MLPLVPEPKRYTATLAFARDHVARARGRTADRVARGAGVDLDADGTVGDGGGAGGVGADEVAGDQVAGRARAVSSTPSPVLPEMTLPAPAGGPADRVAGAPLDVDAALVRQATVPVASVPM